MYDARTGDLDRRIQVYLVQDSYYNSIIYENDTLLNEYLARTDIQNKINGTMMEGVFSASFSAGGVCEVDWNTHEHILLTLNASLFIFKSEGCYDSKEPAIYNNTKCNKYYIGGPGYYQNLYADMDDYAIALETVLFNPPLNYTWTFEYKMEAPLSAFTFDKLFPGRCDDRAYVPPVKNLCPTKN